MAGAVAGGAFQLVIGRVVKITHGYAPLFVVAGLVYVAALIIVHGLVPRLEKAKVAG